MKKKLFKRSEIITKKFKGFVCILLSSLILCHIPVEAAYTGTMDNPDAYGQEIIPVSGIQVTLDKYELYRGCEAQATVSALPANTPCQDVWWQVSDPTLVTVTTNGTVKVLGSRCVYPDIYITSLTKKEVTLTAISYNLGGKKATATITIIERGEPLLECRVLDQAEDTGDEIYQKGQGNYTDESWEDFVCALQKLKARITAGALDGAELIVLINELDEAEKNLTEKPVPASGSGSAPVEQTPADPGQTENISGDKGTALPTDSPDVKEKDSKTTIRVRKSISLKAKKQKEIKVSVINPNGKKIRYQSQNRKIARVSKKGVITGIRKGKTKIVVKCNGVKRIIKVKVK